LHKDMVTTRLTGPFKIILVASRDYLDARGIPKSVTDLYQHNCIGFRSIFSGGIFDWELFDGKEPVKVKTSGYRFGDGYNGGAQFGFGGVGIAYALEPLARRYPREGRLKWLLPQTTIEHEGLFLYYPRRASLARKRIAIVDPRSGEIHDQAATIHRPRQTSHHRRLGARGAQLQPS